MKRWVSFGIVGILLLLLALGLLRPVLDPGNFTGSWYSRRDGELYQFSEGIISSTAHYAMTSAGEKISGAYSFASDSIFLFALGVDGLEQEAQLYLVRGDQGDILCENPDGSGRIFFFREKSEALKATP